MSSHTDPPAGAQGKSPRVLIVDDNRDLALSLARLLQLMGYEVHTVFDGHEGLRAARTFQPRAILLDIGLPNMDGYQVAQALREEGFDETMIIAVSGYGQDEDRHRSQQAGMDHHVTKPVDVKTIASLIGKPD